MRLIVTGANPRVADDGRDYSELWALMGSVTKKTGAFGYEAKTYRTTKAIATDFAGTIAAGGPIVVNVDVEEETYGRTTVLRVVSFEPEALLAECDLTAMGIRKRGMPAAVKAPGNGAGPVTAQAAR